MVQRGGDSFNGGINGNIAGVKFEDSVEPYLFEIEVDLDDESNKNWSFKLKGEEYGPYSLKGNEFKIAAGMCNGGKVKYTFL